MKRSVRVRLWQVGLLLVTLAAWEIGARTEYIDPFFFPLPSMIAMQIVKWAQKASIYNDLFVTLGETLAGFTIGTVVGVIAGLWLALNPFASDVLEPYIKAFNAIPRIVLAPIFALWFGLGMTSKIALIVTLVFFMAFFNTYQGVRDASPVILANARLLRASGPKLLRHIYLPSAAQWILSSLRASIGFAVTGAVVGEYLGSSEGIGHVIAQAEGSFDAVGVFAGLVVLGLFVLVLDSLVSVLEARILVWRPVEEARS